MSFHTEKRDLFIKPDIVYGAPDSDVWAEKLTWDKPKSDQIVNIIVKCQYTATDTVEGSETQGELLYPDTLKEFVLEPDATEFDITEHKEECGQKLKGINVQVWGRFPVRFCLTLNYHDYAKKTQNVTGHFLKQVECK